MRLCKHICINLQDRGNSMLERNHGDGESPLHNKHIVTPEQWKLAEKFFNENPNETKFSRKKYHEKKAASVKKRKSKEELSKERSKQLSRKVSDEFLNTHNLDNIGHSFIKIGDKIYALQPEVYLGKGGFGAVKKCFDEDGNNFAVKIKEGDPDASDKAETEILRLLKRYHGGTIRASSGNKTHKTYNIQTLVPGISLREFLDRNQNLDEKSKLIIALQIAQALKYLHDNNIVHADVAARNFMIHTADDDLKLENIEIVSIDFGLSVQLVDQSAKKELTFDELIGINQSTAGAAGFYDPEHDKYIFDKPLDVFLLGKLLFDELKIDSHFFKKDLLDKDKAKRPTLDETIENIKSELDRKNVNKMKGFTIPPISKQQSFDLITSLLIISEGENNAQIQMAQGQLKALDTYLEKDENAIANEASIDELEKQMNEIESEISKLNTELTKTDVKIKKQEKAKKLQAKKQPPGANERAKPVVASQSNYNPEELKSLKATKTTLSSKLDKLYEESAKLQSRIESSKKLKH